MTDERRLSGIRFLLTRVDVGFGLLSFTLAIVVVAVSAGLAVRESIGLVLLVAAAAAALLAVLWVSALRNGRVEKTARLRLQQEHPGALVERVRLWRLPHGPVLRNIPIHFVVADPREIVFETIDRTMLLRIPVEAVLAIEPRRAQGDRRGDTALTIVYEAPEGERATVQLFTLTYAGIAALGRRIRTAIAWPAEGTP